MNRLEGSLKCLFGALDALVSEEIGIIRQIEEVPRDAGEPDFFHYWAVACDTTALTGRKNFAIGGGAAADRGRAVAKAVGEAVERYCSAIYDVNELPLASYDTAPFPCVRPAEFTLFSRKQYEMPGFPFLPFDDKTPVRWTRALDVSEGKVRYVPAAFVFVPYYYYQGTDDTPIAQPISTGLACHCSVADAAISAICETIERDAFMITWQARLSRPRIRVESLSKANRDLVARFESAGYEITLVNITMDVGVPTILAVSQGNSNEKPPLVTAASTALDPEVAAQKALEELDHTRTYSQRIMSELPRLVPDPYHENVVDQQSHLNFWCDYANAPAAAFLCDSSASVDFQDIQDLSTSDNGQDLEVLSAKVSSVGHRILLCDLTTDDIRDLGLAVVRAIIPGFQPLVVGYSLRPLGGTRLWELPQQLGYHAVTPDSGDNPYPHPYP